MLRVCACDCVGSFLSAAWAVLWTTTSWWLLTHHPHQYHHQLHQSHQLRVAVLLSIGNALLSALHVLQVPLTCFFGGLICQSLFYLCPCAAKLEPENEHFLSVDTRGPEARSIKMSLSKPWLSFLPHTRCLTSPRQPSQCCESSPPSNAAAIRLPETTAPLCMCLLQHALCLAA